MSSPSSQPLWLDYETYSELDIKKVGGDVYARHHSTRALMLGWAIGEAPARLWDIDNGDPMPEEIKPYLLDNQGEMRAFNAAFEIAIGEHVTDFYIKPIFPACRAQWKCAKVLAYALSFAGGLDKILGAIDGLEQKNQNGGKLISLFSKPAGDSRKLTKEWNSFGKARYSKKTHPDEWADFGQYCLDDVEVFRALWHWLEKYHPMSDYEWYLWQMDQVINQRGIPIDGDLVTRAIEAMKAAKLLNEGRLHRITDGNTTRGPLLEWFNHRELNLPNLQKPTKERALEDATDPITKEALELSIQIAQASSSSKWTSLGRRLSGGATVIRDALQFAGAGRTRRWAGQGVQFHNFKRTTSDTPANTKAILAGETVTMDQISTSIRNAIKAPAGKILVVSDLSSIESRLAGWVTRCEVINQTFEQDLDTYKVLASKLYGVDYHEVTKAQRGFAKPAALGCQYMLGAKGLMSYAAQYGVVMSEEDAKTQVSAYRDLYPELPKFWSWVKDAVFAVLRGKKQVVIRGYGLTVSHVGEFLFIAMPSGRSLSYYKPRVINEGAPWDDQQLIDKFEYEGMKTGTYMWGAITAHAGGLLENIIQAVARDILAVWLDRIHQAGLEIVAHVHDEVILVVDEGRADAVLQYVNDLAAMPVPWAPGLRLTADGYTDKRYRKD